MEKNSGLLTEIFGHSLHNVEALYSEYVEHTVKILKIVNRVRAEAFDVFNRYNVLMRDIPHIKKDIFVELIEEAKQYNDEFMKGSLDKGLGNSQKARKGTNTD